MRGSHRGRNECPVPRGRYRAAASCLREPGANGVECTRESTGLARKVADHGRSSKQEANDFSPRVNTARLTATSCCSAQFRFAPQQNIAILWRRLSALGGRFEASWSLEQPMPQKDTGPHTLPIPGLRRGIEQQAQHRGNYLTRCRCMRQQVLDELTQQLHARPLRSSSGKTHVGLPPI